MLRYAHFSSKGGLRFILLEMVIDAPLS
jgi:hypothetical protein